MYDTDCLDCGGKGYNNDSNQSQCISCCGTGRVSDEEADIQEKAYLEAEKYRQEGENAAYEDGKQQGYENWITEKAFRQSSTKDSYAYGYFAGHKKARQELRGQ